MSACRERIRAACAPHAPLITAVILLLLALVAVAAARWFLPETTALASWTHTLIADAGLWSGPLFVAGTAVLSCLFVPRQALAFAGGFALGALWGTLLTTLGTTLGCALALGFARFAGREPVERRLAPLVQEGSRAATLKSVIERAVQSPFLTAVAARLFPSGNNLVFSLVAGLSRIPAPRFIAGSAVGYIPQNVVFALLGSGARLAPELRTASAVCLFVAATGLVVLIWKRR